MTERSLSPTLNRSQNLEKGVFSSLSALYNKQSLEERKQIQSASQIIQKKSPLPKPRSPIRTSPTIKRIEKSPELKNRSPLKIQNRPKEETTIKQDSEILKLYDTIKSLKIQLEREKKNCIKLESDLKDAKQMQKIEFEKYEKVQKNLHSLLASNSALQAEKEKVNEETRRTKDQCEQSNELLKGLSGVLVSILSTFFFNFDESSSLLSKEKLRIITKIRDLVSDKLSTIMEVTKIDLTRQLSEVRGWLLAKNIQKQTEKINVVKDEIPEISFTVEYFKEPSKALSASDLISSLYNKSQNKDEISFTADVKLAVALYDFEGERQNDLSFCSGDNIEIIEECSSGWWVGRLNGKTGCFPYNFVQIL